jgi:hypothetical protein
MMKMQIMCEKYISIALLTAGAGCVTSNQSDSPEHTAASVQAVQGGIGASGGGGGGGGGGMQMATTGLYVIDNPGPGEVAVSGMVLVVLSGGGAAPADTVVTLNGVALAHWSVNPGYFVANPSGPQPSLGVDGFLHLVASSVSASTRRALDLACPARIDVTANPAVGSSLAGTSALTLAWAGFPQNVPAVMNFFTPPSAALYGYDAATNTLAGSVAFQMLFQTSTSASLAVAPTSAAGYLAELRYPGVYLLDGNSGGVCGRAERFSFSN